MKDVQHEVVTLVGPGAREPKLVFDVHVVPADRALGVDENFHETRDGWLESKRDLGLGGGGRLLGIIGIVAIQGHLVSHQTGGWIQEEPTADLEVVGSLERQAKKEAEPGRPLYEPPMRVVRI